MPPLPSGPARLGARGQGRGEGEGEGEISNIFGESHKINVLWSITSPFRLFSPIIFLRSLLLKFVEFWFELHEPFIAQ